MARRATAIKQVRAEAQHTLLLDAGDSLLRDKEPAKSSRGAVSVELMNMLGYDAVTLGGLDLALLSLDELRQRIDEAEFAVLSANAYVTGSGALDNATLVAEPYTLTEVGGHRVAILGLSDPPSEDVPPPPEISVADPLQTAQEYVPQLQELADIIVLLSHAGLEADTQIAARVPGVDVIISARGRTIAEPILIASAGTIILHADEAHPGLAARNISRADLSFDAEGRLAAYEWEKLWLTEEYEDDPAVAEWLRTQNGEQ